VGVVQELDQLVARIPDPVAVVVTLIRVRRGQLSQAEVRLRRNPRALPYRAELNLVFATRAGTQLDPENLSRRHFRPLVEKA
jgi:hypothetical protein